MKVVCKAPRKLISSTLISKLRKMEVPPIISEEMVEVTYQGQNHRLGEALVEVFAHEADHDIFVDYSDERGKESAEMRSYGQKHPWPQKPCS